MTSFKNSLLRWGPALLIMGVIFVASGTQGKDLPSFGSFDFPAKKGAHMAGYALLAIAYLRGLTDGKAPARRELALAVLMAIAYAATDEFHQSFTSGRTSSVADVGIDSLGASLGTALRALLHRRCAEPGNRRMAGYKFPIRSSGAKSAFRNRPSKISRVRRG